MNFNKHHTGILKKGFTLAEVLITLVIIGVVAAITVPVVIANSNEKALKAALRKNHSVLAQAMDRYYVENGEHVNYETDTYKDFLLKYFNTAAQQMDPADLDNIKYKIYSGQAEYPASKYYFSAEDSVLLQDGSLIGCHLTLGDHEILGFLVDVNGPYRKPNRLGKDTFYFEIYHKNKATNIVYQGEAIPGGTPEKTYMNTLSYCNPNGKGFSNGWGCTSKALNEK